MFTKTITPYAGKYLGELRSNTLMSLHYQVYSTYSQAEQALDRLIIDIVNDQAEQGLVDDVPAALDAAGVTSHQLPGWLLDAQSKVPPPACKNPDCNGPHYTWQCPQIRELLFTPFTDVCTSCGDQLHYDAPVGAVCGACREWAEPVVMVLDVDFAPVGWSA